MNQDAEQGFSGFYVSFKDTLRQSKSLFGTESNSFSGKSKNMKKVERLNDKRKAKRVEHHAGRLLFELHADVRAEPSDEQSGRRIDHRRIQRQYFVQQSIYQGGFGQY